MNGKTKLSLEEYRSFFLDPWRLILSRSQLNHILEMHGFADLCAERKGFIRKCIESIDLMKPWRSTISESVLPSAAMTVDEVIANMCEIGWEDCCSKSIPDHEFVPSNVDFRSTGFPLPAIGNKIGKPCRRNCSATPPATFVISGRRPRSKRKMASVNALIASTCISPTGGLPPLSESSPTVVPFRTPAPPSCPPPSPPSPPITSPFPCSPPPELSQLLPPFS